MRDLILKMSISLDAFVAGPNGELDWMFAVDDPLAKAWVAEKISGAGAHLMGSRSFHDMAAWWPYATDIFAGPMNAAPKIAFSRQGLTAPPGADTTQAIADARAAAEKAAEGAGRAINPDAERLAREWAASPILTGDLAAHIERLKGEDGGPLIAHGGARFAASLVATGLIDEFRLVTYPVALGQGQPIFGGLPARLNLRLTEHRVFPSGITGAVYRAGEA